MKITGVKCAGSYDAQNAKLHSLRITGTHVETRHSGTGFTAEYRFQYAFGVFGLNFMSGDGVTTYKSSSTLLKQDFKGNQVVSDVTPYLEHTTKLEGFDFWLFTNIAHSLFSAQVTSQLGKLISSDEYVCSI